MMMKKPFAQFLEIFGPFHQTYSLRLTTDRKDTSHTVILEDAVKPIAWKVDLIQQFSSCIYHFTIDIFCFLFLRLVKQRAARKIRVWTGV